MSRSGEYSGIGKVSYGQSRFFIFISCLYSKGTIACTLVIRLAGWPLSENALMSRASSPLIKLENVLGVCRSIV